MRENQKIEAPWYTFNKKVKALFEKDPAIEVSDIYAYPKEEGVYGFNISATDEEKYRALKVLIPEQVKFGNIMLKISIFDESLERETIGDLFATLFEGNAIFRDVQEVEDFTGAAHTFVRFNPEVIQFFDDDISDYSGIWSGLAQDIAKEVFYDVEAEEGVHFCTAALNPCKETGSKKTVEPNKRNSLLSNRFVLT